MSIFAGRPAEAEPAIKRFRRALRASGGKFTAQQLAYGTMKAMSADDPSQAVMLNAQAESEGLNSEQKSAVDAVLSSVGVR